MIESTVWIPVSERLPEDDVPFVIAIRYHPVLHPMGKPKIVCPMLQSSAAFSDDGKWAMLTWPSQQFTHWTYFPESLLPFPVVSTDLPPHGELPKRKGE